MANFADRHPFQFNNVSARFFSFFFVFEGIARRLPILHPGASQVTGGGLGRYNVAEPLETKVTTFKFYIYAFSSKLHTRGADRIG